MEQFRSWVGKWENEIKLIIAVAISLAVAWYGGTNFIHALKEFGSRKSKEGLKSLGFASLIVFLGIIGYAGLTAIVRMIAPDSSVVPRG